MDVSEAIASRRSIRSFLNVPVCNEVISKLLREACRARAEVIFNPGEYSF